MISQPGFYPDIPMEAYLADPCAVPSLSSGAAYRLLFESARHVWLDHPKLGMAKRRSSKAAETGTAAHEYLFGGAKLIAVCDATLSSGKRKGQPCDKWEQAAAEEFYDNAVAAGKIPILAHEVERHEAMLAEAKSFLAKGQFADVLATSINEGTGIWREGAAWMRFRPDALSADQRVILHYKTTTGSARPDDWQRTQLFGAGYDIAAAFYERGVKAVFPESRPLSVFLVQEQNAPYQCSLHALDPMASEVAHKLVDMAIRTWALCIERDEWPAYPTDVCYAEVPQWKYQKDHALLDALERAISQARAEMPI